MENRNRKGILIIVSVVIVLFLIIISGGYLFLHNKSYKNQAIECGDAIYLNEIKYSPVASSDLKEYTISNVLICKTDTGIKLYEINENTYIADTPGFSTFDISEIPSQELENYFVEFEREKEKCEFIGCTHIKEKNCGVKQAIEEGKISKERYNRFCKIYEELKQKEERKKW